MTFRVFIRRAYCPMGKTGDALVPGFIVRRRRESAASIGAAVLSHAGVDISDTARHRYAAVPQRTVRSWRQRFAALAEDLSVRFRALCLDWRGHAFLSRRDERSPAAAAATVIGAAWRAAERRSLAPVPPPWMLANVIFDSAMLGTRVHLPWPIRANTIGRSRGP